MAGGQEKWYFTKDQLQNSASRKCGLDADKELAYRQQAANLIQDMGQRLQFHRSAIAAAALFLAAKYRVQSTAPKDLAQTSYFMASNSLHLTTMCLQYRPTVVACFCIHLASKWSNWAIPQSNEGRHWFTYVDRSVTMDLLERLTSEFLLIFEKCPSRLKRKMMNQQRAEYERERRRAAAPVPGGYVMQRPGAPVRPRPENPRPESSRVDSARPESGRLESARPESSRQEITRPESARQESSRPDSARPDSATVPPHHQRPSQHHHSKPHHPWPPGHHKHHQKPPHDHRHHRPPNQPQAQPSHPNQPQPQTQPIQTTPELVPQRTRPPSLFSPENATTPTAAAAAPRRPPQPRPKETRPQIQPTQEPRPVSPKKRPDATAIREMQPPDILSPFSSPPAKEPPKQRQRQQSNSEPELQVVVKKLDETPGYENVIRESQRGNTTKVKQVDKKEATRSLNGIETDPTLVSNLLKESLAKPAPITVPTEKKTPIVEVKKEVAEPIQPTQATEAQPNQQTDEPEHKHKKDKKKKEKHKHKDRDKSKEERKKHKKDKEREKKKEEPPPVQETPANQDGGLRITIPRDKLSSSPGLKIKIPKERLAVPPPPPQSSGLKIKISKEVLETSRKRAAGPELGPPQKHPRQNGHPKVGWQPHPPPFRQPFPYYMLQPPPMYNYNYGMEGYYYQQIQMLPPPPQPPLPAMPPPPVPPPPPE
ncbi:Uncharacterized protein OBRU01_00512 [Operophtera brumata]|uniref:Uncharacterized protein n=1 Tax=Operophtera brumata TaxID=104452 RepID=A0A0L7LV80_OPEBR|nr:Uncharacterized protein OBRU01_00512 [Operophtera brumata]